jgi:hypothetical protein
VPQVELVLDGGDLRQAAASLRSLAAGGGAAYDRALKTLEGRYYALTSEGDGRRKPGRLDLLRDEKSELAAGLRESAKRARRVSELQAEVEERTEDLERLRGEARDAAALAEQSRERAELLRRREALVAAERSVRERLSGAEEAAKAVAELDRQLGACDDLREAGRDFPTLVGRARAAHEKVGGLEADLQALKAGTPAPYPCLRNAALALAAALLGGALAAYGAMSGLLAALVAGAGLGSAGLLALALVLHFKRRNAAQIAAGAAGVERAEEGVDRARDELRSLSAKVMSQAGGRVEFSPGAMDELIGRYWTRRELEARRGAAEANLVEDEELEDLRDRLSEAVRELAVLAERIENTGAEPGGEEDAEGPAKFAARAKEVANLVRSREEELHRLEVELAGQGAAQTASAWLEDRLEELAEIIPVEEARCRALQLARSELAASIQEFQESHVDRLGQLAGESVAALTGGRYTQVRLEPESLLPRLTGRGRQDLAEAALSQGTRAALFLALRLAMGKLMSGGGGLPLILDDPLVDLDDERRAAALEVFQQLAGRNQVLLLSCDRRLSECGAALLDLQ